MSATYMKFDKVCISLTCENYWYEICDVSYEKSRAFYAETPCLIP